MKKLKIYIIFFLLCCFLNQGLKAEIFYPWKETYIGALEGKAWCGLVLAPHQESVFAFRVKIEKEGQFADENDIFYMISEVGPQSPDGMYARLKIDLSLPFKKGNETPIFIKPSPDSDTLVLEWSRQDERTVIGRIRAPKGIKLHLVHYFPWNFRGKYTFIDEGQIKGESLSSKKFHYLLWTSPEGKPADSSPDEPVLSFSTEKERFVYFIATVGDSASALSSHIYRYKNRKTIDSILKDEEEIYEKKRVKIEGLYGNAAEAITNNLFWMTLYQPGNHRLYTPAGRTWIFPAPSGGLDHWTIFEWDSFFNALEVSVESSKHARDIIKAVLETQYPNGNIPNWRGRFSGSSDRSQPPVGSYAVLKLFLKLGDLDLLRYAYPYLQKWHSFWKDEKANGQSRRDGNGDGLLEWGTDTELLAQSVPSWEQDAEGKERAMWESGMDDLPSWDEASFSPETQTLNLNSVDLNSLYALDAWCLAQIANILNRTADHQSYLSEYEAMKELINNSLWDEKEGFYFDRFWDGRFSKKKAAANFFPLVAHIPDQKRAVRMIKHLLNPEEFWGDFVIPTISRDDPAYKDQQYWRGTIWPPTNYLVYQGLRAYSFDEVASQFAKRSADLFLRIWQNYQLCPENFDSRSGEAGGRRYQSWGPLFTLIAAEEYIDFAPWEGFRFGMIDPEDKGKLSRIFIQGRHYDLEVSSSEIKLKEEGREILKAGGGAVFRHFLYSENEISFEIRTYEEREISIQFLSKGKYNLLLDDQARDTFKGKSAKIKIPKGDHTVMFLLLEKLD
jgi:hypothetical protein